jgi:glycolate oxidase FAD binding subunit
MANCEQQLCQQVTEAHQYGKSLAIRGAGSKAFLLPRDFSADGTLDMTQHSGVISYEPSELVITARAGTPLTEITTLLVQHGQQLPFDPPCYANTGTLGGAIAAGLVGPGRPWRGAARDSMLGIRLLDGHGRLASFGGQVMKNVAGYDISRLLCGSMGSLAILLEISLRVIPQSRVERTLQLARSYQDAQTLLNDLRVQPVPITGACWLDGHVQLRLSASSEAALTKLQQRLGGEWLSDNHFWTKLRDHTLPFFDKTDDQQLWRLSTAPATALPQQPQHLLDWGGAQHWIYLPDKTTPQELMQSLNPQQYLLQPWFNRQPVQHDAPGIQRLKQRLRAVFNPQHLLNPSLC